MYKKQRQDLKIVRCLKEGGPILEHTQKYHIHHIGIILAAGMGRRMNSNLPKVAHVLFGKPLIIWVIEAFLQAKIKNIVIVISPQHELVKELILKTKFPPQTEIHFTYQEQPLGTGHAAICGMKTVRKYFLKRFNNPSNLNLLFAPGDTPAITGKIFKKFFTYHVKEKNLFTILAFHAKNPLGYGRILIDEKQNFLSIREEKDCNTEEKSITLSNSGFLCANFPAFEETSLLLKNDNAAKEYYITDLPFLSKENGGKVGYLVDKHEDEFLGINSQIQLQEMEIKFQKKYSKETAAIF